MKISNLRKGIIMKNKEKVWALLINLGIWNPSEKITDELQFDQEVWEEIVDESAKSGINTFIIDVGAGIMFPSHPELTLPGAWTQKKLRDEIKRCREKGIKLIPKLNFSATHDNWLGEYSKMLCTSVYYKVCNDMIKDAYELFEHPEYIHIGMDEETALHASQTKNGLAMFRTGSQWYSDIRFLVDCVQGTGAKPMMWRWPLFQNPELYKEWFDPDEVILMPFNYHAIKKEHWTPVSSRQEYIKYYSKPEYQGMNIEFVEQDPFNVQFMEKAIPLMKQEGYCYIPIVSLYNKCEYCMPDTFEYFRDNAPEDQVLGFTAAAWYHPIPKYKDEYIETIRAFKKAKEEIYG